MLGFVRVHQRAHAAVDRLAPLIGDPESVDEVRFLLLEQRFLEHLEANEVMPAVTLLRNQITPMQRNTERVHTLASCLMCRTAAELSAQAGGWAGKDAGSRLQLINRIQAFVPAQTMLPPRRLEELIEESVRSQLSTCIFHNPPMGSAIDLDSVSLLQRHSCGMLDTLDHNHAIRSRQMLVVNIVNSYHPLFHADACSRSANPLEVCCLLFLCAAELSAQAGGWAGKDAGSRLQLINRIQAFVPAQTMLPPRRLEELIEESVRSQLSTCIFHNPPMGSAIDLDSVSLLQRHSCGMYNFPAFCIQTLHQRDGDLWLCQFSPDGCYLAVGGKDANVDVLRVDAKRHTLSRFRVLPTPCYIGCLCWSPDSKKLAACCGEEQSSVYVFDVVSGQQLCNQKVNDEDTYSTATFFADSRKLAFGGLKGLFYVMIWLPAISWFSIFLGTLFRIWLTEIHSLRSCAMVRDLRPTACHVVFTVITVTNSLVSSRVQCCLVLISTPLVI
ncbi:hypothetical protein AHF37_02615 [Paragonimus kellicotti]|nr:hypothetical protein AHF37_02615 [Paragonimus kellicotti]